MKHSPLMDYIFDWLGKGAFFSDLHTLSMAFCWEGCDSARLDGLASTGACGKHKPNIERDAHRWLHNLFDSGLEPYFLDLDVECETDLGIANKRIATFPIHEMLRTIWMAGPLQRCVSLFGPEGRIGVKNWWAEALKQEWGRKHTLVMQDLSKCLGIVIHVDGVEVHNNAEFVVWSWSTSRTAGSGDAWDTKFPILAIHHGLFKKPCHQEKCVLSCCVIHRLHDRGSAHGHNALTRLHAPGVPRQDSNHACNTSACIGRPLVVFILLNEESKVSFVLGAGLSYCVCREVAGAVLAVAIVLSVAVNVAGGESVRNMSVLRVKTYVDVVAPVRVVVVHVAPGWTMKLNMLFLLLSLSLLLFRVTGNVWCWVASIGGMFLHAVNKEGNVDPLSHLPVCPKACPIKLHGCLACHRQWVWANPSKLAQEAHGFTHVRRAILTRSDR